MSEPPNTEAIWEQAILWWSLAAFNFGLLVGIGAMLLDEWSA